MPRTELTANRTYYVSLSGNDSNDGLSLANAFATVQHAIDESYKLDLRGFHVRIELEAGTFGSTNVYVENNIQITRELVGAGSITITSTDPNNPTYTVLRGTTNAPTVSINKNVTAGVYGIKIENTNAGPAGDCLYIAQGANAKIFGPIDFGVCGRYHINMDYGAPFLHINNDYTISGNAQAHFSMHGSSMAECINHTITFTQPISMPQFIFCRENSTLRLHGTSYSGSFSGLQYYLQGNAVITLAGSGLPGSGNVKGSYSQVI